MASKVCKLRIVNYQDALENMRWWLDSGFPDVRSEYGRPPRPADALREIQTHIKATKGVPGSEDLLETIRQNVDMTERKTYRPGTPEWRAHIKELTEAMSQEPSFPLPGAFAELDPRAQAYKLEEMREQKAKDTLQALIDLTYDTMLDDFADCECKLRPGK